MPMLLCVYSIKVIDVMIAIIILLFIDVKEKSIILTERNRDHLQTNT